VDFCCFDCFHSKCSKNAAPRPFGNFTCSEDPLRKNRKLKVKMRKEEEEKRGKLKGRQKRVWKRKRS